MNEPLKRNGSDKCFLACGKLSLRWPDLPVRQRSAEEAPETGAYQATTAWALGNDTGTELYLCPPESPDQTASSEHDLYRYQ